MMLGRRFTWSVAALPLIVAVLATSAYAQAVPIQSMENAICTVFGWFKSFAPFLLIAGAGFGFLIATIWRKGSPLLDAAAGVVFALLVINLPSFIGMIPGLGGACQ